MTLLIYHSENDLEDLSLNRAKSGQVQSGRRLNQPELVKTDNFKEKSDNSGSYLPIVQGMNKMQFVI